MGNYDHVQSVRRPLTLDFRGDLGKAGWWKYTPVSEMGIILYLIVDYP